MQTVTIRKVRPDTVPYGEDIRRGPWVYAAYNAEGELLGVYASSKEAKRKHGIWPQRDWRIVEQRRYKPGGDRCRPKKDGGQGQSKS